MVAQRIQNGACCLYYGLGLAGFLLSSQANGATIVSTESRIWGGYREVWYTDADGLQHDAESSFDDDSSSLSGLALSVVTSPYGWNSASGSVTPFSLEMQSLSSPFGLAYPWGQGCLSGTYINLFANSRTLFKSEGSVLSVRVSGSANWNYYENEQDMRVILKNLTTSTTLLDLEHLDERYDPFDESFIFAADPAHDYELTLFGWLTSFDAKSVDMNTRVALAVPEPSRIIVFLALALAALCWRRRAEGLNL